MEWDIRKIQETIPHRYPFLLVDKVIDCVPGEKATGIKNVTMNEPFFEGHFPDYPVMPGVLIVEALAQVGVFAILSKEEYRGKLGFFTGIDKFKFRDQVKPGDVLTLDVELVRMRKSMGKATGVARVDGNTVAEGEIKFAVFDPE